MTIDRIRRGAARAVATLVALPALGLAALPAHADESWPTRAVTLVLPVPPGGTTDKTARILARALQARWKQPVVIDNRTGASGNIASAVVARAAPDGYTLLVSAGPFSINPSLFASLPFDTVKDFTPVAQTISFASALIANAAFPARTLDEFLAMARDPAKPISYASAGSGTAQHLAMELLRDKAKLSLTHVPYKGGAPAISDLLGNHVPIMLAAMGEVAPLLADGRVRALATTGETRPSLLPDLPTLQERGLLDFDTSGWNGIHAPANTPAAIVTRINADVVAALADPTVKEALTAMGVSARPGSVADFQKFFSAQLEKWKIAVRLSGAKVD